MGAIEQNYLEIITKPHRHTERHTFIESTEIHYYSKVAFLNEHNHLELMRMKRQKELEMTER